jgi:hypothetical protein
VSKFRNQLELSIAKVDRWQQIREFEDIDIEIIVGEKSKLRKRRSEK